MNFEIAPEKSLFFLFLLATLLSRISPTRIVPLVNNGGRRANEGSTASMENSKEKPVALASEEKKMPCDINAIFGAWPMVPEPTNNAYTKRCNDFPNTLRRNADEALIKRITNDLDRNLLGILIRD
jgi:hypothetical protein